MPNRRPTPFRQQRKLERDRPIYIRDYIELNSSAVKISKSLASCCLEILLFTSKKKRKECPFNIWQRCEGKDRFKKLLTRFSKKKKLQNFVHSTFLSRESFFQVAWPIRPLEGSEEGVFKAIETRLAIYSMDVFKIGLNRGVCKRSGLRHLRETGVKRVHRWKPVENTFQSLKTLPGHPEWPCTLRAFTP